MLFLFCFGTKAVKAQSITCASSATNGSVYACPNCSTITALDALNCDMIEHKADGLPLPTNKLMYGFVYAGAEGMDAGVPVTGQSYIYLKFATGLDVYEELPMPGTTLGTLHQNNPGSYIVNDPDIALGIHYASKAGGIGSEQFALVAYEVNGEIYIEAWGHDLPSGVAGYTNLLSASGGQIQISNSSGTAYNPHVDLIADNDPTYLNDLLQPSVRYVVTWEEGSEVKTAYGDLFATPTTYIVGTGHSPDVAGVTNLNATTGTSNFDDDVIYTTYIDGNGDLSIHEYYIASGLSSSQVLEYNSNGTTTFYHPRIAAPVYYDYNLSGNTEPVSVVAATIDYGVGPSYKEVKSYCYYDPAGSPAVVGVSVSDYMSNGTLATDENMMPSISGVGDYVINKYSGNGGTGHPEYPIVFYSSYTTDNGSCAYNSSGNGDLYNVNIDPTSYAPTSTNYNEVFTTGFSVGGWMVPAPKPLFASSVCNNSGYGMFAVYFSGSRIDFKYLNNSSYNFKPTDVNEVVAKSTGFKLYPNPATKEVNVSLANTVADDAQVSVQLVNMYGQLVSGLYNGKASDLNANKSLQLPDVATGIYMVQIVADGQMVYNEKLVIE